MLKRRENVTIRASAKESKLKLYELYNPELKTNVSFKQLSEQEIYKLSNQYKDAAQDDFMRAVLESVVYNLKEEVAASIKKISKDDAKKVLSMLFNCSIMINPGLDVISWLQIANSPLLLSGYDHESSYLGENKPKPLRKPVKSRPPFNKISRAKFLNLERHLKENIIGQDESIDELVSAMKRSHVGLNDEDRPLGVFVFAGASGVGKAQPLDAHVLTPTGYREMGDIKAGSQICNPDGTTQKVLMIHPQGIKPVYEVTFVDGAKTQVTEDHLWLGWTSNQKLKANRQYMHNEKSIRARISTTSDYKKILDHNSNKEGTKTYPIIPLTQPVNFNIPMRNANTSHSIDPYILGALLGDGSFRAGTYTITTADSEILQAFKDYFGDSVINRCSDNYGYRIADGGVLKRQITDLGLNNLKSEDKFVPHFYLYDSIINRFSILQGLMDTDGSIYESGAVEFTSTSSQLALDVQFLVRSLGGKATISEPQPSSYYDQTNNKVNCLPKYRVNISFPEKELLFRLSRKAIKGSHSPFNGGHSELGRRIISIEYIGEKECQCITVDHPNSLYITDDFIVTHNTLVAKELHKYLFGNSELIRVDCGEYQHKHENQKLIGCFVPGTAIQMADGRYKNIEDISIGETVISHTGIERLVEKTFQYENVNPMISISFANSNVPIITTAGHEILIAKPIWERTRNTKRGGTVSSNSYSEDNLQWVPASELQKDDIVVFPRNKEVQEIPTIDLWDSVKERRYQKNDQYIWSRKGLETNRFIKVDEAFARLAGYYISEGGSSKSLKTFNFTFGITEADYVEEVITLVHKIFGSNISYKVEKRATHNNEPNSWRVFFHSRAITILFANLFGKNTWEKRIPKDLLYANENIQYNLLETSIFGDGSTSVKRRVQYDTVSRDLFSQLNFIFKRLGFTTHIQVHPPKKAHWSTRYRIYLSGTQILQFSRRLPDLNIQLGETGYTGIQRMSYVDEDYIYYQITNISNYEYKGSVYDLKIAEDTSYCANGIAVHNSPPGYLGHDEGGQLTNALIKNPNTVVLLDEVEKADPDLWNTFLRVFDEGWLTDSAGKKVSFHNAIIIMTTNLGNQSTVKDMQETKFGFQASKTGQNVIRERVIRVTTDAIRKYFRPEFLNRIDKTVVFNHLNHDNLKKIAELELDSIQNKLNKRGYIITYEDSVVEAMINEGVDNIKGARGLSQVRRDRIENLLADSLMQKRHLKGTVFKLDFDSDEYQLKVQSPVTKISRVKKEI